jgi:2-hydroxy-6-oxonona-2,4-dienedioate hydrolase
VDEQEDPRELAFDHFWRWVGGVRTHARVSRVRPVHKAPPVVMVHGLGLSGRYMLPVAHAMAHDYRIFLPDFPGFGDSDEPSETLDTGGLADSLAAWLEEARLEPAVLLGNSFGCQVAIDVAARFPDLIQALVLQGPTTPPDERHWWVQFRRWRQNTPYNRPGLSQVAGEDYRKAGYRRIIHTFQFSLRDRPEDKLAHIDKPALIVRGEFDPICREEWATEVAQALPQGHLVILPHVAHTLVWDAPAELGSLAADFIRQTALI